MPLAPDQPGRTRTFTYDGHGRLSSRKTPEQGTITYAYNKDDTVLSVMDERGKTVTTPGATTTFAYNYRRQPTSITYSIPSNVTRLADTPDVAIEYDTAGNRTSMVETEHDSQGQAVVMGESKYTSDSMSRLASEARTFKGLAPSYKFSYLYNKTVAVTRVTASSSTSTFGGSAVVNYNRDRAGRPTSVTGSGYAGVTSYVTSIGYRAFGD